MKKIMLIMVVCFSFTCSVSIAADIKPALVETFGNEGGKQCDKSDLGNQYPDGSWGCTQFGMSPRSYPNMPKDPTLDYVAKVYERDFWNPLRLGEVKSQIVANAIFDYGINQGEPTWKRKIQEAINLSNGFDEDIVVDGIIGPKTISLLNKVDQVVLYFNITLLAGERYHKIVTDKPSMREWYNGWAKRVVRTVTKAVHDRDEYLQSQRKDLKVQFQKQSQQAVKDTNSEVFAHEH